MLIADQSTLLFATRSNEHARSLLYAASTSNNGAAQSDTKDYEVVASQIQPIASSAVRTLGSSPFST